PGHRQSTGRPMTCGHRTAGFTLLETLVALTVLSFIVVGLSQALHLGLAAWSRQSGLIDRTDSAMATDQAVRTLVSAIEPGTDPDQPALIGSPNRLSFTTRLPSTAPVGMTRLSDVTLGIDVAHQLVLHWVPHLHARLTAPLQSQDAILLRSVAAVH